MQCANIIEFDEDEHSAANQRAVKDLIDRRANFWTIIELLFDKFLEHA